MGKELKRMRYFDGLLLNAEDYKLDQDYQKRLQQLHNRYLHTWGIVTGLDVEQEDDCKVTVKSGLAINEVETPDNGESTSQLICVYDGEAVNTIDLSEYSASENVFIFVSYGEIMETIDNTEKGKGQEIHILERGCISHSANRPKDEKKYILLARVSLKPGENKESVIDKISYYESDEKTTLRRYAGPAGRVLALEKIIFKLKDDVAGMPFIRAIDEGKKGIGLEVNSTYTNFTGSVNVKGDLTVNGQIHNENKNQNELLVSNCFVQVNSKSEDEPWLLQDGGLEVYRGGVDDELDARLVWSENDKRWKIGIGYNLSDLAYGPKWDPLVKNGIVDGLHKHSKLSYKDGVALEADNLGNLSVHGDISLNDKTVWFRSKDNTDYGLGWFGAGKQFAGINVDGPVLFGFNGGVLGTTEGGQKPVLSWNSLGNVGIGIENPRDDMLEVSKSMRILSDTNPIRFTSAWSGFADTAVNHAEISNDTGYYKALMIVGNKSAGQVRKVAVWDRLDVNGFMYVNGSMQVSQALTPSAGNGNNNGIVFPSDPGGGKWDSAWLKYYPRSGEACVLEIGTSNDGDDNISLMASGSVGIGTLNPQDKLDVSGWTRILSGSNPIRFTSNWSGFPDSVVNQAEICNDTTNYKSLMIVGNKSGNQGRKVSIWDRLDVNGILQVNGDLQTNCAIVPSVGEGENNGIMFPKDYYGGSGDAAWIRYYSDRRRGGGENMTLEIGISNDPGNGTYYGGGDRIRLAASGGVYVDGYFYYSSSRDYKENIKALSTQKAKQILEGLNPVTFNFKGDTDKTTLGFIAEDVPSAVAALDKKAISPMEIIAVLTSVVKDQKKTLVKLQQQVEAM